MNCSRFSRTIRIPLYAQKPTVFDKLYFFFFLLLPFIYCDQLVDPVLIPRQFFLTVFVALTGFFIFRELIRKKSSLDFAFMNTALGLLTTLFITICLISIVQSVAVSESIYVLSKVTIEITFFIITTIYLLRWNS